MTHRSPFALENLPQEIQVQQVFQGPSHFDGQRFFNPGQVSSAKFLKFLQWQFSFQRRPWPCWVESPKFAPPPRQVQPGQMAVTFVNHATVMIQFHNCHLVTDPVWSDRVSPVSFLGPKRVREPGVRWADMPRVDLVLISHNHYDHLDVKSLRYLRKIWDPLFVAALGDGPRLRSLGLSRVVEMDWGQKFEVEKFQIYFLKSLHWSGRWIRDRYSTLWGSFWIQNQDFKIYFAGDTGYSSHFSEIKDRLGSPDLSLLPIGAYEPRWFMKQSHMNPAEAVKAHLDLGSRRSMGIHFGTFRLTDESIDDPVKDLAAAMGENDLTEEDFFCLAEGQTRFFTTQDFSSSVL